MKSPAERDSLERGHQHRTPCHCCPDHGCPEDQGLSRRGFLATSALGGTMFGGLTWTSLAAGAEPELPMPKPRVPLKVLPILVWDHPRRAEKTSWRKSSGFIRPRPPPRKWDASQRNWPESRDFGRLPGRVCRCGLGESHCGRGEFAPIGSG